MFTSVGHRSQTLRRVRLGATRDGRLVAVDHEGTSTVGALDDRGSEFMDIGMTMLEETVSDPETGRIVTRPSATACSSQRGLADLDVVFVGGPDTARPPGIKGIGEIGVVGVSAAANAVYHATGRRIRSLPITVEQLL